MELADAYYDQIEALVEGGVDILLPETTFDTLNLKAAIYAIEKYFEDKDERLPVMLSANHHRRLWTDLIGTNYRGVLVFSNACQTLIRALTVRLAPEICFPAICSVQSPITLSERRPTKPTQ